MSSSPTFLDPIIVPLVQGDTVLDVACGYGRWCHLIQSNFWEAGMAKPPAVDGFDAFLANVDYCRNKNCYRHVWQHTLPAALDGRWDTVLACEIIEHIDQKDVADVVGLLERAANRRVIFSTPNWPAFRPGGDTLVGHNEFEAHLSYVSRSFFRQRGYKVIGAGFGNPHNAFTRTVRSWYPRAKFVLESIPRVLPVLSHTIVAYKDVGSRQ